MTSVDTEDSDASHEIDSVLLGALNEYLDILASNSAEQLAEWQTRYADSMPRIQSYLDGLQLLTELSPVLRPERGGRIADLLHISPVPSPPLSLGDFRLIQVIGKGGMGVVYLAEQITLQRKVAVKILPLASAFDARMQQRFQQEAQAAAQLHHAHIVPVFTVGCQDGVHFYAMQLIEGQSLAMMIEQNRTVESAKTRDANAPPEHQQASWLQTVVRFGIDVAEAVSYAHEHGVIHRDIKPANLLIDAHEEVFVADFGLAITQESIDITTSGPLTGTLRYASPEQVRGKRKEIDHRTDIYSLGATLYEMLTLAPPFPGEDYLSLTHEILTSKPKPLREINPAVPRDLETIILKAMAAAREDRYPTAWELAEDLRRFSSGAPVQARRIGRGSAVFRTIRRRQKLRISLSIAAIALLILIGFFMAFSLPSTNLTFVEIQQNSAATNATLPGESLSGLDASSDQAPRELTVAVKNYAESISLAQQQLKNVNAQQARNFLKQWIPQQGSVDLRGFEWYALHDQCISRTSENAGHEGDVYWLTWSSDSRRIATASKDRTVRVWDVPSEFDAATSQLSSVVLSGHSDEVNFAAFSPDGKQIATASDDGAIRVWKLDQPGTFKEFKGHDNPVVGVAFSPFTPFIVSGDNQGQLFVWSLESGELLSQTQAHTARVEGLAFTQDGSRIASASDDSTVGIWNAEHLPELTVMQRLTGHERAIHCVAWSNDDTRLLVGGWDGSLRVWEQGQPTTLPVFRNCRAQIHSVSSSPDDRYATCTTYAGYIHQIDAESGEIVDSLVVSDGRCWCAQYSPDGKWLAAAGESKVLTIWSADPQVRHRGETVPTERMIVDIQMSGDGRHLVTSEAPSSLTLRSAATGEVLFQFPGHYPVKAGFALGQPGVMVAMNLAGNAEFWDLSDEKNPLQRTDWSLSVNALNVAISADRNFLTSFDQIPRNLQTREFLVPPVSDVTVGGMPVMGPNNNCFPVTHFDNGYWWYPREDRRVPCRYLQHPDLLAFSPDGNTVYVGTPAGLIYQLQAGMSEPAQLPRSSQEKINDIAISPDGRTLVSAADDGLRFWNPEAWQEMMHIDHGPEIVSSAAFHPDGRTLVYATSNSAEPGEPGKLRFLRLSER